MRASERRARRAAESELHKKGYKTMAMNPREPEPCEPLAADGDSHTQPSAGAFMHFPVANQNLNRTHQIVVGICKHFPYSIGLVGRDRYTIKWFKIILMVLLK